MTRPEPDVERRRTLVHPVRARLVDPAWAARVVSPLHDVLTEDERRAVLADNPDSFLHVTSDPLALPETLADAPADAAQARALRRLLDQGAYRCLPEPSVFVYRMRDGFEEHTGVVACVDLAAFADGRVLGHEAVQPARVEGLVRHYRRVGMRSELVALFHRADPGVTELLARVCREPAELSFTDAGGIEQWVWRAGPDESQALVRCLDGHRHYIGDGHHRVAAALRCWERDGRPEGGSVLCALYPQDQVFLHAFHRRVHGPVAVPELLAGLESGFDVRPAAGPDVCRRSIGLYAAGHWQVLVPRDDQGAAAGGGAGVAGLDVTMLDDRVLRPLLGIRNGDPRLEFVPDVRNLEPTIRACDEDGGVLFTLHAPGLEDLISVAERREVMSAKTTFVKPKPRTGIFLQ
jgi:uncharacterized protein (DUF1015 family)